MRHDSKIKDLARLLRKQGKSLNEISTQLKTPKTTTRLWIKDIALTKRQKIKLRMRSLSSLQEGRKRAAELKRDERILRFKKYHQKGLLSIGELTKRDLLLIGTSLYWAEGFKNKHEKRLGFCNSDPAMIRLYLRFLKEILFVKNFDLTARLSLNENFKPRTLEIQKYWSEITDLPLDQFTKTFYQKTQWKKEFTDNSYFGVLRIHVQASIDLLSYMKGLIEGVAKSK